MMRWQTSPFISKAFLTGMTAIALTLPWLGANAIAAELETRFTAPPGWTTGMLTESSGAQLRWGHVLPTHGETPVATIVMLEGFQGFSEKSFETIRELQSQGYEIWTLDWHGQGGSSRWLKNPQKPWSPDFSHHIQDLDLFMGQVVLPSLPKDRPLFAMSHSMGGNILLRYLHDRPGVFDFAVFAAPMFDLRVGDFLVARKIARWWAHSGAKIGQSERYVPTQGDWVDTPKMPFGRKFWHEKLSHDAARLAVIDAWMRVDPSLRIGGPTFGWAHQAYHSMDIVMKKNYAAEIKTPILIGMPTSDSVVSERAEKIICKRMADCELAPIRGGRHEIWLESDEFRNVWVNAFNDYVQRHLEAIRQHRKAEPPPTAMTQILPEPRLP